jgi:hypothetical protein
VITNQIYYTISLSSLINENKVISMTNTVGRPLLKHKPLTSAEKSKRLFDKKKKEGLKARRLYLSDKTVKDCINKFGGKQSSALEEAITAAVNAPTSENGQLSLISNSQKMEGYDLEIKALKEKLKNIHSIVGNYEKKAKSTRDWVQAIRLINEIKTI